MITVYYCRPYTCQIMALDIADEHVETYRERLTRNAFCPRTLWAARPELFRLATEGEIKGLMVHEWIEVKS